MNKKIILFTQYFECNNNELRQLELDTCLKINCNNPFIDEIILLNEKIYDIDIMKHTKIKQVDISHRLTYNDVFNYSNKYCNIDDIKILTNTDIILSYTDIQYLKLCDLNNNVFALLRYELIPPKNMLDKEFLFDDIEDIWVIDNKECKTAQDVWIFNNIKPDEIYNFNLGIRGCDNRIAYLLNKNKYNVTNPSESIKTYHLHNNAPKSQESRERRNFKPFSKWEYKELPSTLNEEFENYKNDIVPKSLFLFWHEEPPEEIDAYYKNIKK